MDLKDSGRGSRRQFFSAALGMALAGLGAVTPAGRPLRACGAYFRDARGRVVLLRGVNLAGDSKVPPFVPLRDPAKLDILAASGFNLVRLLVTWEALEPRPGCYDFGYLEMLRSVATACGERGLHVILDIHQDGFARIVSHGSGEGFPSWAVSPRARRYAPDNTAGNSGWFFDVATDPGMYASFTDFFADKNGVRSRYLTMMRMLANHFAAHPAVIGYDPLNEPWGNESRELAPLYEDAARVIRSEDPGAILFIEGQITTNCGIPTRLASPVFSNFAYAPHYYKPITILSQNWRGGTATIDAAFRHMRGTARDWNVPLLVGEFGVPAEAHNATGYISEIYDRLDAGFASAAQWNYTPGWTPTLKDGWNGEDFNIIAPDGTYRPNFTPRAWPVAVAGTPIRLGYRATSYPRRGTFFDFEWHHQPELGDTEIYLPDTVFGPHFTIQSSAALAIRHDPRSQRLMLGRPSPGPIRIQVTT